MKKFLAASLAVFVFYFLWDKFLVGPVLGAAMASIPGAVAEPSMQWVVLGDLFAAMVLTGLYARTRSIFGATPMGGATYGVYAGLLVNFPTWLFMSAYFSWPYKAAWHATLVLIVVTVVAGAVMGAVYQAMDKSAA
jgi:hypothetical protein